MPRAELELLAEKLPQARLEVITGAGHLAFLERPQQTARVLLDFLVRFRSSRPRRRA